VNARFEIHWMNGELRLSGHTVSRQHERDLLIVAGEAFPDQTIATNFEPLGIVPDYWSDASLKLLYALARTASAHAILKSRALEIRSIVVDDLGWQARYEALLATLASPIVVTQDTIHLTATREVVRICRTALNQFKVGPINFRNSSAILLRSALPRLSRVTALADICRDAIVAITGHTDSSGNETWNQRLSENRANAVADFLVKHGIDRTRLHVFGAASSAPIADNKTRFGRGLNRRIDIVLSLPAP
jgi:OOP family OmpA-OmpF porin